MLCIRSPFLVSELNFGLYYLFHLCIITTGRKADPSVRTVQDVCLRPLARWDCEIESRQGHVRLCLVSAVCCQVEVPARGRGDLPNVVFLRVIVEPR